MKTITSILSAALLALHLLACDDAAASADDDTTTTTSENRSELRVAFAPSSVPGADALYLTISGVRARTATPTAGVAATAVEHRLGPVGPGTPDPEVPDGPAEARWYSLVEGPITLDLSHPSAGVNHMLGQAQVPAAAFAEIEFQLENAVLVRNGQQIPVEIAAEALAGVTVQQSFQLTRDQTAQLTLAFDLNQSPGLLNEQNPVLVPVVSAFVAPVTVAQPHMLNPTDIEPADPCTAGPRLPSIGSC